MQKSAELGDIPLLGYIEKKNDSIVKIRSFDSNKLSEALQKASNFDYNTVFIGDNNVQTAVNQKNRRTNTKFKFINTKAVPPYQSSTNELQTN